MSVSVKLFDKNGIEKKFSELTITKQVIVIVITFAVISFVIFTLALFLNEIFQFFPKIGRPWSLIFGIICYLVLYIINYFGKMNKERGSKENVS